MAWLMPKAKLHWFLGATVHTHAEKFTPTGHVCRSLLPPECIFTRMATLFWFSFEFCRYDSRHVHTSKIVPAGQTRK